MKGLKLGAAREIITPKVGGNLYGYSPDVYSTSVSDDLTATALCFDEGGERNLLISITVCEIATALCGEIRCLIEKETGIKKECIMLCATHTHSAPNVAGTEGWGSIDEEYCRNIFIPRIISASKKACSQTVPVTVGVAFGESFVGVNRRETTSDGSVDFGQDANGPFNPVMTVISFKDDNGEISFICVDTDDDDNQFIKLSASWLLPKLHHAGYPAQIVEADEKLIMQNAGYVNV